MPVQHNIAPPLTHLELERAFDLITICRGEQGGVINDHRPKACRERARMFRALDEPSNATWREVNMTYLIDEGDVIINWGEAVLKYTDKEKGSGAPTREQLFHSLEQIARHHR